MNSRTNRLGDFLDHLFDRIIDISILSVLLWSSSEPLFALGTLDINYTNLFFIILAALALTSFFFRLSGLKHLRDEQD